MKSGSIIAYHSNHQVVLTTPLTSDCQFVICHDWQTIASN